MRQYARMMIMIMLQDIFTKYIFGIDIQKLPNNFYILQCFQNNIYNLLLYRTRS